MQLVTVHPGKLANGNGCFPDVFSNMPTAAHPRHGSMVCGLTDNGSLRGC